MSQRLSRESLLGASDLIEREVELDTIGGSVLVRSLPAAYSNQAQSEALELITETIRGRQTQTARVSSQKLEELQVLHGLIDPKLDSLEQVRTFAQRTGRAWRKVVDTIDEISGIDKASIEKAQEIFRPGSEEEGGRPNGHGVLPGDGRPDLPLRTGA